MKEEGERKIIIRKERAEEIQNERNKGDFERRLCDVFIVLRNACRRERSKPLRQVRWETEVSIVHLLLHGCKPGESLEFHIAPGIIVLVTSPLRAAAHYHRLVSLELLKEYRKSCDFSSFVNFIIVLLYVLNAKMFRRLS